MNERDPGPPDGELVRRALDGDREAFCALVERHEGWVRNLMAARLRRWQDVEEGAQECFVKAFSSLGDLRVPEAFRGWLRSTAERVSTDLVRRKPPRLELRAEAVSPPPPVEQEERRGAVARAVEALEEPYREVVVLRYDRGLSCVEIARELGVTVGAVTMRLTRAHRALAGSLEEWREGRESG